MLVCAYNAQFGTRDRGCSVHPAFPAPSMFEGRQRICKARAKHAARTSTYVSTSLRGAKRRSNPSRRAKKDGLLRFARNDGDRLFENQIRKLTLTPPCRP